VAIDGERGERDPPQRSVTTRMRRLVTDGVPAARHDDHIVAVHSCNPCASPGDRCSRSIDRLLVLKPERCGDDRCNRRRKSQDNLHYRTLPYTNASVRA
jgi:translation initiation factor 2 beta subunit (eIF-2beta)/eIF-5